MFLDIRDTRVLEANPSTGVDLAITDHGNNWLWAVAGLYFASFLAVTATSYYKVPYKEKIFHYLMSISLLTGSVAYFTAASNLGWLPIVTSAGTAGTRQIYYSKYINWFVGWVPIIITLGIIARVKWAVIIYNVTLMWIWIATWLIGAMVSTTYKWAYFAFGTFTYFLLAVNIGLGGKPTSLIHGLNKEYTAFSLFTIGLWLPYSIAWALDDGANESSVTRTWIFWGILDIFSVPVFALGLLVKSRMWSPDVYTTGYTRPPPVPKSGYVVPEKPYPQPAPVYNQSEMYPQPEAAHHKSDAMYAHSEGVRVPPPDAVRVPSSDPVRPPPPPMHETIDIHRTVHPKDVGQRV